MAADSPFIIDVTSANFESAVIEASHRLPVLVDFWATWCGPCQVLLPLLTRLAHEYGGQFILAKANIDEQQELAHRFAVRSVPTVILFRGGAPVDQFLGAQPESTVRALLDAYVERESDRVLARARELASGGALAEAIALAAEALAQEPENPRLKRGQAELLVLAERLEEADALLRTLPADLRTDPEVAQLLARIEFGRIANGAPASDELERRIAQNPGDSEARYQLGARRVLAGDFEGAMAQLLELLRRDRAWGNDAGRTGLLRIFELLGGRGELVSRYRGLMFNALH